MCDVATELGGIHVKERLVKQRLTRDDTVYVPCVKRDKREIRMCDVTTCYEHARVVSVT